MSNSEKAKKNLPEHYSKTDPYSVTLKEKLLLSHPDSSKKTYHISLDISGSDLIFHPGDSIGVLPQNDPTLVAKLFNLLSTEPQSIIVDPRSQKEMTAEEYLLHKVNFYRVNASLIRYFYNNSKDLSQKEKLQPLVESGHRTALAEFTQGKDIVDVIALLQENPIPLQDIVDCFTPLLPRFYSIASSIKACPDELHLLVALLSYNHGDEVRYGVASHFLCHLADEQRTPIPIYIQPAAHFKLPDDNTKNLIMIGPGTGVAPYRSFLQERICDKASGKHWLFFGERSRKHDFLYKDYFERLESEGKLKLTTAFSRDQEAKEYVQHKILENAEEIWDWLSNGSYLFVCGNASHMAKDVEATLLTIIENYGNLSEQEARAHLKHLRTSRQYMTDVY
jgi:sulfite reductase (NADPH) flavoprotein alpha-component